MQFILYNKYCTHDYQPSNQATKQPSNQATKQPSNQSLTRLFFNPFLLIFLSLSLTMCSSSSGGSSPASPTGLFLRPTGDANTKVYSNGQGLLLENSDGSTNEIVIGTFDHDRLTPYNIKDEDDEASDGDDISIKYSYNKLAENLSDDYRNALFSITENVLSFTGVNSGVLGETPPYKLSIETTTTVAIDLPATFDGYINTDASNDDTDADTRKFSFSGGTISKTDVAATEEVAAHRTISVTKGKIYVADATKATGKIINFEALDSYKLPATPDIYQYYIIVTDENNDGTGDVSAVAEMPTGTEFYVLGEVEAHTIQEVTVNGIKFTDKPGGRNDWEIKAILKPTVSDTEAGAAELNAPEVHIDGNTIIIKGIYTELFDNVLAALRDPANGVMALVEVTTVEGYTAGSDVSIARIGNTEFASTKLSGGVDADTSAGTAAVQAQATFAGLTVVATSTHVGADSNRVELQPVSSGNDGSNITLSVIGNNRVISITYDNQATLADLITAINSDTAANALVDFVGTAGTDYDGTNLLIDVLAKTYALAREGADSTANETGEVQTGAHTWTDEASLGIEDYVINLAP